MSESLGAFQCGCIHWSESNELGIVGGELFEDGLFIGGRHRDVAKVTFQLVEHGGLIGDGGRRRIRIRRG